MAATAEKPKKTCYYELLGLDRKCEAAEIKTSYRKLALQMHPDKAHNHGLSVEEATKRFQQIQEAYSVLSDAQERAWYDAHREQILRGDDEQCEDPFKTKINLYKFFSASCFDGFSDGPQAFFAVYADLFEAIDAEEAEWEDADDDHVTMPPFGNSRSEWEDVSSFYRHWMEFCSRKSFAHAEKWNPRDAQNRQVRRAMEQENKKARQAAKKEFNAEVRQLVGFVRKRDPRVAAHAKDQMKATAEKTQRAKETEKERKAAQDKERQERKEAARQADEERWAEAAATRAAQKAKGEVVSADEDSDEESEEEVEYRCEACRKSFKSEKAFDQHAKSKKHQQMVAKLRRELELEMEAEAKEAQDEEDESDSDGAPSVPEAKPEAEAAKPAAQESSSGSGSEEEEEDDFVARFAAARQPKAKAAKAKAKPQAESSDDDSEEEDDDQPQQRQGGAAASAAAAQLAGKKAQKRAKQKALLQEKQAEKAKVQEMVDGCRKAAKAKATAAAAAGEANAEEEDDTAPPAAQEQAPEPVRCEICNEKFSSRSKLFQHIRATGHAALKPAAGGRGGGRKKMGTWVSAAE